MSEDLAKFSAEQTARFLGGGEIGLPTWADPDMQRKQDEQRERLRASLETCVKSLGDALHEFSPSTEERMKVLYLGARAGDVDAMNMLITMVAVLMKQALVPKEESS